MANAAQQLKSLQTRQNKLNAELKQIKAEEKDVFQRKKTIIKQLKKISHEIQNLNKKKPIVSEHAVIQYLVRTEKINLQEVQEEIMNHKVRAVIDTIKSGHIPISSKLTAVVKNYTVVTVISSNPGQ